MDACGALYKRVAEFPLFLGDFIGDLGVVLGLGYPFVGLFLLVILEGMLPSSKAGGINCISRKAFIRVRRMVFDFAGRHGRGIGKRP